VTTAIAVLHTLGELHLEGGQSAGLSSPRIALTLLVYLARRSPKPIDRGELADVFWRERDSGKARQSLRQVLLELKRIVGHGLLIDHDKVSVAPDAVALDIEDFERDIRAGRWREALAAWGGEFLPSADSLGGEDLRLWLETERERLHRSLRRALRELIQEARGNGNWEEGAGWGQRWVELLPLEEEGHRHLIELTQLSGRTAEALSRYTAFRSQLRAIDSTPTPAFLQLGAVIERDAAGGQGHRTPGSAALFTPDLTGRGHPLAELEALWRTVCAGASAAVLVEGEVGIGKSRLCEEFLRQVGAERGGATMLRARAHEHAPGTALSALAELALVLAAAPGASGASAAALAQLADLAPAIRDRFPSLPRSSSQGNRLEDAFTEVLTAVAAERPVVLYFDDLPLADSATQETLISVNSRVASGLLFLATGRAGEDRTSAYRELVSRAGMVRLKLQPLSEPDIELLLGSMLELDPVSRHHLARRLYAEAGGNPLFSIELIAALVEEGSLVPTDHGAWRLDSAETRKPMPLPATIREVVGRRLDRLSPEARAALEGAAVLGHTFDPALVPTVAGMAPATWTVAQEELIARRIVRDCPGTAGDNEFTHEIIHRVAYDLLPAPRRAALHRAASLAYKPAARRDVRARAAFNYHRNQSGVSPHRLRRRLVTAMIASGLLLGAAGVALLWRGPGHWDLQRVQVLPFENQTGDTALATIGRMAADWINLGLVQTRLVTVVSSEEGGSDRGAAGAATLVRGRYYADGDSLRFRAEVLDARSDRVLFALEPVTSLRRSPMDAIERVRQRLTALLATYLDPRLSDWTSAASKPTTFEAYQEYAAAVELFLQLDYRTAIVHYERAARLDPGFTLALLDAAIAYMNLGEYRVADSIAELVGRSPERLPPFDLYWLRWMQAHLRGDRVGALKAVRQAASLTTGSEAWYQVGYEARALNRPHEAIAALRRLDPAKEGEHGWYPYWDQLTTAYHLAGEHKQELEAARSGRRQYPDIIPTLSYEVRALAALGRMGEVRDRLARGLSMPTYDRRNPATLMRTAAEELEAHGHPDEARVARRQGITWLESRSADEGAQETNRFALAQLLYLDDRLTDARALLLALAGEHPENISYQGYLGVLAARAGDTAEATRIARWLGAVNRPYVAGVPSSWQARIAARLGRPDEALDHLDEALARGGQIDLWFHTDVDLASVRDHPRFRALLRPKD
jgi:DNA-binding SARP family transcriptional activator/tetratricopeptide (TPR) repeat protein